MIFKCFNPNCPGGRFPATQFRFEGDKPLCPKCGASDPAVVPEVAVHFLAPHERGPFADAQTGVRRHVACQPDRDFLATLHGPHWSATEDPGAVTCPACRRDPRWQQMAKVMEQVRAGFRVADGECCG